MLHIRYEEEETTHTKHVELNNSNFAVCFEGQSSKDCYLQQLREGTGSAAGPSQVEMYSNMTPSSTGVILLRQVLSDTGGRLKFGGRPKFGGPGFGKN